MRWTQKSRQKHYKHVIIAPYEHKQTPYPQRSAPSSSCTRPPPLALLCPSLLHIVSQPVSAPNATHSTFHHHNSYPTPITMFCIALLLVSATIIAGLRAHFTALQSNDKSTSQICELHQYPARSNHHNDAGEQGSSLSKHTSTPLSTTSPFTSHAVDATCLTSSPTKPTSTTFQTCRP